MPALLVFALHELERIRHCTHLAGVPVLVKDATDSLATPSCGSCWRPELPATMPA